MIKNAQTKVIFPVITLGLLRAHAETGAVEFRDRDVKEAYRRAVEQMRERLGHTLHIGGRYYDAYPSRNLPRYQVLHPRSSGEYELDERYAACAEALIRWIPQRLEEYIERKLGVLPSLSGREARIRISESPGTFVDLVSEYIRANPTNFEIFAFAILKVHLEKFACKLYRDSRASAKDGGIDIATNFGVVYQIKKMRLVNEAEARKLYGEIAANFDTQRVRDGNVVVIIDDVSKEVRQYLIDMKIQSLSSRDVIRLAEQFEDVEDREKVLRVISEEFVREYGSADW